LVYHSLLPSICRGSKFFDAILGHRSPNFGYVGVREYGSFKIGHQNLDLLSVTIPFGVLTGPFHLIRRDNV
jgi:hypothetical protein